MVREKDKIEYFKRECRNYNYYKAEVHDLNLQLEDIAVRMQGVSSPHVKEVILENARDPYHTETKILQLMMEEEELINQRSGYQKRIDYIETALDRIRNEEDRELITALYIDRTKRHDDIAEEIHYSKKSMYRRVNRVIKSVLCQR